MKIGCTEASQALHEANDGCKAYPQCCIRLGAYDAVKQVQVMSFLVRKPGLAAGTSSCPPAGRCWHHRREGREGLGPHGQQEGDPTIRCSVDVCPPEDNMDSDENHRGPGVTRAPLWVSPGTPARPCLFSG